MITTVFKFIRLAQADDHCKLGWLPTPALQGTHHGDWSVLMEGHACACGRQPVDLFAGPTTIDRISWEAA
jgi:hypothetical protein